MPYSKQFVEKTKPFGMSDETWTQVKAAQAEGSKVEWEHSSYDDPGDDWNKVLIDGKTVFHQAGF